jgi:GGDEF domain-containing protein
MISRVADRHGLSPRRHHSNVERGAERLYGSSRCCLIGADPGMARQIAGRVQTALQSSREELHLTVRIGVTVFPDDSRTIQDLLEAADRQLYQRKRASHARGVSVP